MAACLKCLQNCFLCLVTGQIVSATLESLRVKVHVQGYLTYSNQFILEAHERTLHNTQDHSKRVTLAADIINAFRIAAAFGVKRTMQLNLIITKPSNIFIHYHAS